MSDTNNADQIPLAETSGRDYLSRLDRSAAQYTIRKKVMLRNRRPMVSFTFDDIPQSAFRHGASTLYAYDLRGTFYVSAALFGNSFGPWRFIDREVISDLADQGHEIGCHTYTHTDIQTLSPASFKREIQTNHARLCALDDRVGPINFAYPYGSVGMRQKGVARRYFTSCRGVHPGINYGDADLAHLRAIQLNGGSRDAIRTRELLRQTARLNGWLIFYTHDVRTDPSRQGCTPDLLKSVIFEAQDAGCDILPVRDALQSAGVGQGILQRHYAGTDIILGSDHTRHAPVRHCEV